MATELCQKCKQAHPGHPCDYDAKGDCAETVDANDVVEAPIQDSNDKKDAH